MSWRGQVRIIIWGEKSVNQSIRWYEINQIIEQLLWSPNGLKIAKISSSLHKTRQSRQFFFLTSRAVCMGFSWKNITTVWLEIVVAAVENSIFFFLYATILAGAWELNSGISGNKNLWYPVQTLGHLDVEKTSGKNKCTKTVSNTNLKSFITSIFSTFSRNSTTFKLVFWAVICVLPHWNNNVIYSSRETRRD